MTGTYLTLSLGIGAILVAGFLAIVWLRMQTRYLKRREFFIRRFFALANEIVEHESLTASDVRLIQSYAHSILDPSFIRLLIRYLDDPEFMKASTEESMTHLPRDVREKWHQMFLYGMLVMTTIGPILGNRLRMQLPFAIAPDRQPSTERAAQAAAHRRWRGDGDSLPQAA